MQLVSVQKKTKHSNTPVTPFYVFFLTSMGMFGIKKLGLTRAIEGKPRAIRPYVFEQLGEYMGIAQICPSKCAKAASCVYVQIVMAKLQRLS